MRSVRRRTAALLILPLVTALLASCGSDDGTRTMGRALPPDAEFTHPGVLVGKDQLDAVRENVNEGRKPWLKAFLDMRDSKYGAYKYRSEPYRTVSCPAGAMAGRGCIQERADAIAAYTQALMFTVTGKPQHAVKAREIMDGWSAKLERHTGQNAALQAAWAGSTWARAAEIIRHTPGGDWPAHRVLRFETMLRTAYLPHVTRRVLDVNGNRDLVSTDAAIGIAVFLDDHKTFDHALQRFRDRVPAYFYLRKDGRLPLTAPGSGMDSPQRLTSYWFKQSTYKDGVTQETCRDFEHVGHSLAATAHIAETAWHQGVDLYAEAKDRLKAALSLHARHQLGAPAPTWLCGGRIARTMGPDLEVALNHLEDRLHLSVPTARKLAEQTRPAGTDGLFVAWETLTHAGNPAG
ncbi:alginate lyase family protein [Streptomyces sp. NPDC051954]|uniref:alginate lyase family protein n=1 Tax=unclassified Streptomyces TaxID=2593676 RepID=UPI00342BBE90